MTTIRDRVLVNIPIQTLYATQRSFRTMMLIDDDLVPKDSRYLTVPINDYQSVVGTSGTMFEICRAYFQTGQGIPEVKPPTDIVFGAFLATASSPAFSSGGYNTDYTVYKPISDGTIRISDGTNDDDLTGLDFTSINSHADFLAVLNVAQAALTPNIAGMDTAVWSTDATGRLTLTNSTTGASAATFVLESEGTGTDLSTSGYFDVANGVGIAGLDVETLLESYTALKLVFDDFWGVMSRGATSDAQVELARQIENEDRHLHTYESSANAVSAASTADLASVLNGTWGLKKCSSAFSFTESYPEVALVGGSIGAKEGSCAFGFIELSNVQTSGQAAYNYRLTPTQATVLESKNYNWIETIGGFTNAFPGRTVAGQEIRLLLGRDWIAASIQLKVYTSRIQRRILGFDEASLSVYETNITEVLDEALKREIIQSYVLNMPLATDFTDAEKASHNVELDVFDAVVVTDGWRYEITGRMTL